MKLISNHLSSLYLVILIAVSILSLPSFVEASQTSIYQEVNTSSNTGGQYGNSQNNTGRSSANVEVYSETNINGERHVYQFSSSSPNSIDHQVIIENGVPQTEDFSNNSNYSYQTNDLEMDNQFFSQNYQSLINSMINLISSLKLLYGKNSF